MLLSRWQPIRFFVAIVRDCDIIADMHNEWLLYDLAPKKGRKDDDDDDDETEANDDLSPFDLVPDDQHDALVCMGLVSHSHITFSSLYYDTIRSEVYRMNGLVSALNYTPDR